MNRTYRAILMLVVLAAPALGQTPGNVSLAVALGPGINSGTVRYRSSFPMTARLAAILGVARSFAVEGGLPVSWGAGPQGDDVILTQKTPFRHLGATLSVVVTPGRSFLDSGFRLLLGAGVYRISDVGGQRADLTRGAIHVGVEKALNNPASRLVGYLGIRSVWFPELGGNGALHVPLELGLRVR